MHVVIRRLFWQFLVTASTVLCLSGILSLSLTSLASAHPSSCTFTLTTSAQFSVSGSTNSPYYSGNMGTVTLYKYADGCGNEYGAISVFLSIPGYHTVTGNTYVSVQNVQNTSSNQVGYLQTPVTASNNAICGGIGFTTFPDGSNNPDGGGGGGGCTPN